MLMMLKTFGTASETQKGFRKACLVMRIVVTNAGIRCSLLSNILRGALQLLKRFEKLSMTQLKKRMATQCLSANETASFN